MPNRSPNSFSPEEVRRAIARLNLNSTDYETRITAIEAWPASVITAAQIANWDTAFGWGDHSAAGYLKADGTVDLTGNLAVDAAVTIDGRDISVDGAALDVLIAIAAKVAVDAVATPGFLGAAFNDGVLRTSTGITYTDGGDFVTLTTNDGEIDHGSLAGTGDDDHTDYHTDGRAATWLTANHETTYNHANYDTAVGWGDHASGGYLKADGTVPLTADWTTGIFSIIGTDHWYMRADNKKMYFGTGDDASIYYSGSRFTFDSQEVGTGGFYFKGGTLGVGGATWPTYQTGVNIQFTPDHTGAFAAGLDAVVDYGSAGSGNMGSSVYGFRGEAATAAAYDGDFTGAASLMGVESIVNHYGSGTIKAYGARVRVTTRPGSGIVGTAIGTYTAFSEYALSGGFTNLYGIFMENIALGTGVNYAIWTGTGLVRFGDSVGIKVIPTERLHVRGGNALIEDNYSLILGTGKDASIYYNTTNLIINPKLVGAGIVDILGVLQTDGYNSADGTAGVTGSVAVDWGGTTRTLSFKDGLYIGFTTP